MENCVFCKIIKKEIPASIIYENVKTIAFLDVSPAAKGHILVLPKNHHELFSDMNDEDSKALILTMKKISKGLLKFSEGLNIIQNNKKVAGQYVPHVHFHLIPRNFNDGITISEKWNHYKYQNKEIEETAEEIRKLINN
ncbi:HIT family protein [Candidatus Woesearchaeota archaeon]|nr:HIT family protein [Candidatus Woesearchaeota archaeon]